ncbi:MAG: hypothetical protein UX04_C0006G0003 [Microgenomates group bacterium GW2011_GWF2_45_18]|nr:MAG: hypothetical protein UW18_C0006G0003 [Microgenomates group bacterium GW2011_GWF1_44_10]KKU01468.1 MAG: hypothetical protein UX04_C0006G0003 [Microgenomates group bacterium GW2011_GWF2_45_18]OGJ40597.1 MAG: hypothetical protein A2378_01955 [Candidatus Pacebacteria bacterium RIFOXYB1_FULL_44_10]HAX01617.1 hypothetical protein [Candidatus Paceibacterota bacterium]
MYTPENSQFVKQKCYIAYCGLHQVGDLVPFYTDYLTYVWNTLLKQQDPCPIIIAQVMENNLKQYGSDVQLYLQLTSSIDSNLFTFIAELVRNRNPLHAR